MIDVVEVKPKGKTLFELKIKAKDELKTIVVHQETVIKYQLFQVRSIEKSTLKKMMQDDVFHQAYAVALTKLARRSYTPKKLQEALIKSGVSKTEFPKIIAQLKQDHYLDEEKTLDMVVEDFLAFTLKGPKQLRAQLEREGFALSLIEKAMLRYDEALEVEKCQALIDQSLKKMPKYPLQKIKEKLFNTCYQKGFNRSLFASEIEKKLAKLASSVDEETLFEVALEKIGKQYDLNDKKDKQKVIQKLMRQGFRYDVIKNGLD